jgi:hypothetical protein
MDNHTSNLLQNAVLLPAMDTLRTGTRLASLLRETNAGSQVESGLARGSFVDVFIQPNKIGETMTDIEEDLTDTDFAFEKIQVAMAYSHGQKFSASITTGEGMKEIGINRNAAMLQSAAKAAILAYDAEHIVNVTTAAGIEVTTRSGAAITYANTVEKIRTIITSKGIDRSQKIYAICAPSAFRAINALPEVRNNTNVTASVQTAGNLFISDVNIEFIDFSVLATSLLFTCSFIFHHY